MTDAPRDPVVLRRVGPDDATSMREMIVGIQRDEFGFDITLDDQPDLSAPDLFQEDGFYRSGNGAFWVAVDGAEVVGSIALRDCGHGIGALRKMFVAASHRGERPVGPPLAATLLSTLVAHARANGFDRIVLGTTDRFAAAHRFYEKQGFARIGEQALPPMFPRMAVDTRFYEMRLT
jgi:RimJ/RimL family protein N-acetyltransferase